MSTTSITTLPADQCTGTGERDEPDSAGDTDVPPEPGDTPTEPIAAARIEIVDETTEERSDVDEAWIRTHLARALLHVTHPVSRVTISIVDDTRMTQLHRRHCNIESTTDVLTFPMSDAGDPIEVDIAICVDVAARRAVERGHDLNHELLLYALHGVLHCAGYDDHTDADYRLMHAEEDRILNAIGVGEVFGRQEENDGDSTEGGGT